MSTHVRSRLLLPTLALLLVSALRPSPASCQPIPDPTPATGVDADADSPDLGAALRQFYVHVLAEELGLPASRAQAIEPKVRALLEAQRLAKRDMVAAGLGVKRAAEGARDPAAAISAFEEQEREGRERTAAARQVVLDDLAPRQDARFLTFEGRFRERVRELVAGAEAAALGGNVPQASGPRARPATPAGPPRQRDAARNSEGEGVRDTRVLMFVHEVRTEFALDDARTLALIEPIERLIEARLGGGRERQRLLEQIRERAWDDASTDSELDALVKQSLAAERAAADATTTARRKLLSAFSPIDAARFLVLEQRVLGRARQQGQAARGMSGLQRGAAQQRAPHRPGGPRVMPPGAGRER